MEEIIKICAFSDFHGDLPNIEPCDLVIIAGDIIPFNIQHRNNESNEWIKTVFTDWCNSIDCKYIVAIPGNHDRWAEGITMTKMNKLLSGISNIHMLRNDFLELDVLDSGYDLKIFGTPYCARYGNWPFMREDKVLKKKFAEIPDGLDILITHDPPNGLSDCDYSKDECQHLGSLALTDRIEDLDKLGEKPRLIICGHIHEGSREFENGIINVAMLNRHCNAIINNPTYMNFTYG